MAGRAGIGNGAGMKAGSCPPRIARWLLEVTISRDLVDRAMGDFEEIYAQRCRDQGKIAAGFWYWGHVLRSLLPFLRDTIYWRLGMVRNYLKVTLRNFRKQRIYALINILGLAVGLACCLLIFLYVRNELSYDAHHDRAGRIHRLTVSGKIGDTEFDVAAVAAPTAAVLMSDYPEVEEATRLYTYTRQLNRVLQYKEKAFKETRVVFADPNVFDVFTIPFVQGDPATALAQPNTIVVSEELAEKYFGSENPLGKTLTMDGDTDYEVTGVYKAMPGNSHFHFDFMAALITLEDARDPYWLNNLSFRTYILLKEGASADALVARFPGMVRKYIGGMMERAHGQSFEELLESGMYFEYGMQPLRSIHLRSDLIEEFEPNSNIQYVYVFSAVAVFILILACINFMNLSTARAMKRAKEVGIRKVAGSHRTQLIVQFLSESVVMGLFAAILALVLVGVFLPTFNQISGKDFMLASLADGGVLTFFAVSILVTGILAGFYPAFSLSSFRPIFALKQESTRGTRGRTIRNILVVFQFAASIVLIIGTLVVSKQLRYIQNENVGFDREQILIVQDTNVLGEDIQAFKQEVLRIPDMMSGTVSSFLPVPSERMVDVCMPEGMYREKGTPMQRWQVDYDYIKTMGMEIVEGRDFSREFGTDSSAIIVNEAAARHFGWEQPIGKKVGDYSLSRQSNDWQLIDWPVIGVVRNFHFESLRNRIGPVILQISESPNLMAFRFKTGNLRGMIDQIRNVWKRMAPAYPFEFSFMDERFQAMYNAETRIGRILGLFAGLAVCIGAMGLFGLATFTAEQRTKEIGIRKVLGGSVSGIILLLSREFTKWVFISNIIAWPVAYFTMERWLQAFEYRTSLSWWIFAGSGLIALVVAVFTVIYQSVRAATVNPIESLRYE
jgi:putative ABC transport system permease protein